MKKIFTLTLALLLLTGTLASARNIAALQPAYEEYIPPAVTAITNFLEIQTFRVRIAREGTTISLYYRALRQAQYKDISSDILMELLSYKTEAHLENGRVRIWTGTAFKAFDMAQLLSARENWIAALETAGYVRSTAANSQYIELY